MTRSSERTVSSSTGSSQRAGLLVSVLICGLIVGLAGVGVGPASGADQVAIIWAEPEEQTVEPGETIELEVVLQSEGGHGDTGLDGVTLVGQFDPEILEVTAVERGPWLEGEDGANVETAGTIENESGTVILEQTRDSGGATGVDTLATLTVDVAEDAPATTTSIAFGDSDAALEDDWPIAVVDDSPTVTVDGEETDKDREPFDHPDPGEFDLEEGVGNPSSTDGADRFDSSWPPLLGASVGAFAIALGAVVVARRYRS
ncbi:cellulosome anchor protein [Natronolimnobius sp. AArcel1]|uniref:cohesin domain-containing protein n=1 Tax=Natronolimnobius sp. AArcel1 TaxID=1679093 RepID=UPI0013EAF671|nr:cohesin domain-containing protein [Natronolimnobius sp. AArcel1]NGM68266.1 cellulosome anchor protein [Natronolimnobius sp. AArcel1]